MKTFHANGKLLITGEYLVLNGAVSLAVPTKKGQSLMYNHKNENTLSWESIDVNGNKWFDALFSAAEFNIIETSNSIKAEFLQNLLKKAKSISENKNRVSGHIKTVLEFPRNWGFGSSSTLITCVAKLFNINPFKLHFSVSNGSGYDIACATATSSICYKLINKKATFNEVKWNPSYKDSLYFVHLNTKQDSAKEVAKFNKNSKNNSFNIETISSITEKILNTNSLAEFINLIEKHEQVISKTLDTPTIKDKLFKDFKGSIKSLGAWGGDFILVCGDETSREYFKNRGYLTQLNFDDALII
ncbi:MAG: GYDIA family GHMP kinase [Flavobacteriales bacterium]|nr:GYDIA family GHMP kinase [Flavobacteriales bacterium]